MATLLELEAKFLECHICLETYRRPKTIPCLHSFCEQCLNNYIANCSDVQGASFPCPVCKQYVECPKPNLPRSQWASSFKASFFLNDLADCLKHAAASPVKIPCSLCNKQNAEKFCVDCDYRLCRDCTSVHSKIPTSRNHEVVDSSECSNSQIHRRKKRCCHIHTDRIIELYCQKCSAPLCQMCHLIFHKHCPGVVQLTETAEQKRQWLKEVEKQTNIYVDKLLRLNESVNQSIEAASLSKISDGERVKEFFIKTIHALRKKQEDLLEELERAYRVHIEALTDGKREREELLTAFYNARDLVRSLVGVGSDWEIVQEAESDLGKQVEGLIKRVDCLPRVHTSMPSMGLDAGAVRNIADSVNRLSLAVTPPSHISQVLTSDSPAAMVPLSFPVQAQRRTPKLIKRVKTRTSLDTEKPEIWDIVVLPAGQLILLDAGNSCIKGMNMAPSVTTVCRLNLRCPFRVCKLSENEVVVTCQDCKLYVISVSDKLEATRCIQTQHEYWGLAKLEDTTLVVSCLDLNSIHIIDLSGKVLHSISRDASGNLLFRRPSYLAVTPDSDIVVSDCLKKCIFRLDKKGDVRFVYPCSGPFGLNNPRGVCCDPQGWVLCVDKEGQRVVRLSSLGRFAGNLLTTIHGISYPEALAIGPSGVVYVTSDAQANTQDVLLFELL